MTKRSLGTMLAVLAMMATVLAFQPALATGSTGTRTDPTGAADPLFTDDTSGPADYLDITTWSLAGDSPTAKFTGIINVLGALPKGEDLPKNPDDTGYTFYWLFQSGGTGTMAPSLDPSALAHQRQRTGLNTEGERYTFRGPYPIGDFQNWALEMEWRYAPDPTGADWKPTFSFTELDPSSGFGFTELLPVDNPGLGGGVSSTGKQITITMPYTVRWRSEQVKGAGLAVGQTYSLHSMKISQAGHRVTNIWVSSWANSTVSLPPAVCGVTQPAFGLCSIGGVVSQDDQSPNTATVLGEYGFVSYVADENCPVFASTPIAASGSPWYVQVNPIAVNPNWKPCMLHLPLSRTFVATGIQFIA